MCVSQVGGSHTQARDGESGRDVLRERTFHSGLQWHESETGGEQRGGRLHLQPQEQLLERETTEYVTHTHTLPVKIQKLGEKAP